MKSSQPLAYGQYVGEAQPVAGSRAIGGREVLVAIALLVLVVGTDHLSLRVGSVNLRVELIVGGLLTLWFLARSRGAVIQQLGIVEYALLGWLATEGLSNLEMHNLSPFSDEDRERIVKAIERLVSKGIAE